MVGSIQYRGGAVLPPVVSSVAVRMLHLVALSASCLVVFSPTCPGRVGVAPVWRARPALSRARVPLALQGPPPPVPGEEEEDPEDKLNAAYRLLGVTQDAGYDEVTDAHIELTERYSDDPARVQRLDDAKDLVVAEQLRRRMAGELRPVVTESPWDKKPVQREMPWVPVVEFLQKFIRPPGFGHFKTVSPMFTILLAMPWFAPSVVGSVTLLSCVAGFAFTYNRGQADVPKDEWGQVGEIRPYKRKPMLITIACCTITYTIATVLAKRVVGGMVGAQRGFDAIVKSSFLCLGLFFQALIVDVHAV